MTSGGHGDGDGSGVDDWMRSGLNADVPGHAPVGDPASRGSSRRRVAFLGAGLLAAGFIGVSVVVSTIREGADPGNYSGSTSSIGATTTPAPTTEYSSTSAPPSAGLDNLEYLDRLAAADPVLAGLVADCRTGLLGACDDLLDLLAQDCQDGDLPACDGLYQVSPVGSDYENYGATCGGRVGPENAGRCETTGTPPG